MQVKQAHPSSRSLRSCFHLCREVPVRFLAPIARDCILIDPVAEAVILVDARW
jgi:hypothetical protein